MTLRRATLYIGGGTLLVAWFSSAASMSSGRNARRAPQILDDSAPGQSLALSVQAQTRRLKERLATVPVPPAPTRNPFAFGPGPERVAPAPRIGTPAPEPISAAIEVPDLPLMLVGLAEHRKDDVVLKSAVITSDGQDLIMAEVGTVLLGRYTVTSIENDAVEMKDSSSGRVRRIVLQ